MKKLVYLLLGALLILGLGACAAPAAEGRLLPLLKPL